MVEDIVALVYLCPINFGTVRFRFSLIISTISASVWLYMSILANFSNTANIVETLIRGWILLFERANSIGDIPSESEDVSESLCFCSVFCPLSGFLSTRPVFATYFTPLGTTCPIKWTWIVTNDDGLSSTSSCADSALSSCYVFSVTASPSLVTFYSVVASTILTK